MLSVARQLPSVACLCLGLAVSDARADQPPPLLPAARAPLVPFGPAASRTSTVLAAIHAEVMRPLSSFSPRLDGYGQVARPAFELQPFIDHDDPAVQLRALRHYRVLRLWDDERLSVFLGVNRAGVPGLHFQQRDPDDQPAGHTISSDLWLLRAVLPRSR